MGTTKRERQKSNRQLRLEELAKLQRKQKVRRRSLQLGIIIPIGVAGLILLIVLVNHHGSSSTSDTTVADTSAATDTVDTTPVTDATTTTTTTLPPLPCPKEDGSSVHEATFPSTPPMCIDATKVYVAAVKTSQGNFTIELDPGPTPKAVNNFVYLARYHYFDNTVCPRVVKSFVVQCGTPDGTLSGGPGYTFVDELPAAGAYQLGSVAMANSGPDTNGSQFFIITGDQGVKLQPDYTLFGKVTDGFDTTVKAIDALGQENQTPSQTVTIQSVTISVKPGAVASPTTTATTTTTVADTILGVATTLPGATTSPT